MAAEWIGKCESCDKWRDKHDTHRKATRRDSEGNPSGFVIACDFCSTSIQLKPTRPQPPLTPIEKEEILLELDLLRAEEWHSEEMNRLYGEDIR